MSATVLLAGLVLAAAGQRFPARQAMLERCGGAMVLGGVALLGMTLAMI